MVGASTAGVLVEPVSLASSLARARCKALAVYGGNARPEEICDLGRLPAKHLAEDQDSALLRRQVLERRAEREPDGLMGEDSVLGNPAARVQPVAQGLERRAQIRVLAILRAGGVPDELAVLGEHLLFSVVKGFTMDETGEGGEPPPDQPPVEEMAQMARDYVAALPADRFPNLVAVADYHAISDPGLRFELLLDVYVEGLSKRAGG